MLILTRRPNETLCIGDDVRITVLAINGAQVRLGIQAPLSVAVDREEIYERKREEGSPQHSSMRQHLKECDSEKAEAKEARPHGGASVHRQARSTSSLGCQYEMAKHERMNSEPIAKTIHHALP